MRKLIFILTLTFVCCSFLEAQELKASASKSKFRVGERIKVGYTASSNRASSFKPGDFGGLDVVGGPFTSSNVSISNGKMTSTKAWYYYVVAKKEGKYNIGPATITIGNQRISSSSLKLEALTASNANAKSGAVGNNSAKSMQEQIEEYLAKSVYLKAEANKDTVYLGEDITVQYNLYTAAPITNYQITEQPEFAGFWNEKVDLGRTFPQKKTIIDDEEFTIATLLKTVLYPQKTGELSLSKMKMDLVVSVKTKGKTSRGRGNAFDDFFDDPFSKDPFSSFFSSKNVDYAIESEEVKITVLPLPEDQQPGSFTGAVGRFSAKATCNADTVETGEPFYVKVAISGNGNLQLIDAPELRVPEGFEVYDPSVEERSNTSNASSGYKYFEYMVIAQHPGKFTLPPLEFSYFDPMQERYFTNRSPSINIAVNKSTDYDEHQKIVEADDVAAAKRGVQSIKLGYSKAKKGKPAFWGSKPYYGMLSIPFFAFVALFFVKRRKELLVENESELKQKGASKVAIKKLAKAKALIGSPDKKEFYDEVIKSVWNYLEDRFKILPSEQNRPIIRDRLSQEGAKVESIQSLFALIDACEIALYAPGASGRSESQVYEEAVEVISLIEEESKND